MDDLAQAQDTILAMRQMGHATDDEGLCTPVCIPCAHPPTFNPHAFLFDLKCTDHCRYNLSQWSLVRLAVTQAQDPMSDVVVDVERYDSKPALIKRLSIYVTRVDKHSGKIRRRVDVLPLYAMEGVREAFTAQDTPKQPNWREATSEGLRPDKT